MACRFVALNKNPGVRQIGIGEIPRWIIAKAILHKMNRKLQAQLNNVQAKSQRVSRLLYMLSRLLYMLSTQNDKTEASAS